MKREINFAGIPKLTKGERLNVRLERAKRLYEIWANRHNSTLAFELLSDVTRYAWVEVAKATVDAADASCESCGEPFRVTCPACEPT